ncbi:OmpA family protein [Enhygromyxa salina]|uniref:Outer membrane protein P6 n=1 Tax=Enhygromyxa salina TaxID=215803 RepID=A0A2S9YLI3_9BACT|nr:OmpA family protein [Enhygromyxa salina]PRQ05940.1 Outer membrane protein P6 precursor [Enhygromyxa salina]
MRSISASVILTLGLLAGMSGCSKPEYPACKKDKHCEPGETCVDNLCQNCQADSDCKGKGPNGEDLPCVNFRCDENVECKTAADCDAGMVCNANKCEFCTDDSQCESGVCNETGRCEPLPCNTDDDCPVDEICDGGQCIYKPLKSDAGAVCGISALYFAFDSAKLTPGNQQQLTDAAPCFMDIVKDGSTVVLEAHADNIGTEEYNILLTDRRGTSVRSFLSNLGVENDQLRVVGKGALQAQGNDESSRSKDRRVQFIVEAP